MNDRKGSRARETNLRAVVEGYLGGMPSGEAIMAAEEGGQQGFVGSDLLPVDSRPPLGELAAALDGFEVLGPCRDDPLFVHVRLPKGWQRKAAEHAMWNDLVDEAGRRRAMIFFKASFYDRSAFMAWSTRFTIERRKAGRTGEGFNALVVLEVIDAVTGEALWGGQADAGSDSAERRMRQEAEAWLDRKRPGWREPAAYW